MAASQRPLSPHLQIYKPQITSVLSILHRATGGYEGYDRLLHRTTIGAGTLH